MLRRQSALVEEVLATDRTATDAAWKADDATLEQLVTDCYDRYSPDLTAEEQTTFWFNTLRYLTHRYGVGLWRELNDPDTQDVIVREFRKQSDRLTDGMGDLEGLIQEQLQDGSALDGLLDGMERELNRFMERLQQRQEERLLEEEGTPM